MLPVPKLESHRLTRIQKESEMLMTYFGLFSPKKRGRPLKYDKPLPSSFSKESVYNQDPISLQQLNLAGTVASLLIKNRILTMEEIEPLHKIFLLRRRYLKTVGLRMETKSQLQTLSCVKRKQTIPSHLFENEKIERAWRQVALLLNTKSKDLISFIDATFALHGNEDLQRFYEHFIKKPRSMSFSHLSKLCEEAWQEKRKVKKQ